ncbi:MAG: amidohydrolase family protein [Ruminiclostridium sp.]|nr:amidohydrolase family protein [Ruminiclostridium sp.]
MIIDIHTHTFPDRIAPAALQKLQSASRTKPFSDGTVPGLSASMSRGGIDMSVVLPVATDPRQVSRVNDNAAIINSECSKTGIFSFGCIHPDCENWYDELERVSVMGLKGIKLHPAYQTTFFDDPKYLRILNRCGQLGLVVSTHAGIDIGLPQPVYCTPQRILNALKQVGPVTLILAHVGGWRQWDEVEQLLGDAPVWFDTAYSLGPITPLNEQDYPPEERAMLSDAQFVRMVKSFGVHRFLFGSDSPWNDQRSDVQHIRSLPLTGGEQTAILGENARKLLGFQ